MMGGDAFEQLLQRPSYDVPALTEGPAGRCLGYRYFFTSGLAADFTPIVPVVIVAWQGAVNDWAAYIAGIEFLGDPSPELLQHVHGHGAKLSADQARGFFPNIVGLDYRP